jgi:hypothetical protein
LNDWETAAKEELTVLKDPESKLNELDMFAMSVAADEDTLVIVVFVVSILPSRYVKFPSSSVKSRELPLSSLKTSAI